MIHSDEGVDSPHRTIRRWHAAPWIASLGVTVYWAVLGNRYSLWYDEAVSVWLPRMSLGDLAHTIFYEEANMGPYYLVLWVWEKIFAGAWWARGLSLLGSICAIWGIWVLVRRRASPMLAGASTIIFAVNPFVLDWTLQVRAYTAVMALVVWALVMADEYARTRRRREAVILGLLTGLCTATLLTSVFVLAAIFATLLAFRPTRDTVRGLLLAGSAALAVFAPFAWSFAQNRGQNSWVPPFSADRFRSETIASVGGTPAASVIAVALVILFIVAAKDARARVFLLPVGFAAVGIVGLIALSYLESPMYAWRYMAATPLLLSIAVVGGTTGLSDRHRSFALGGLVASCAAVTALWSHHALPPDHDYRWAIETIESEIQPGDWVAGLGNVPFTSVRENWGDDRGDVEIRLLDRSGRLEPDADESGGESPRRVWVVILGASEGEVAWSRSGLERLQRDFPVTVSERVNGRVSLVLVSRDS